MSIIKKLFLLTLALPTLLFAVSVLPAQAAGKTPTLQACFVSKHETFGTVKERAATAAKYGIWKYKGTAAQNKQLSELLCPPEDRLGFAVVTDYQKGLSAPMTSSQSFVPVTSLTLKDGTTFNISDLGGKVFLTLEPGATKEEIVLCTGISTSTLRFTGCTRGLAFKGTDVSSITANASTHNAGSAVVMSNVHYVYQQFVDVNDVNQTIQGTKTFTSFPKVTSTTAIPVTADQLASKYYVDNVGAGGFTCSNVSSTLGLFCTGSVPEKVGINASTTGSIAFDASGKVYVNPVFNLPEIHNGSSTYNGVSTHNGAETFNNSVVVTAGSGSIYVPTPTDLGMAVNLLSLNAVNASPYSTSTAGAGVTTGTALYVSTASTLFQTDTTAATSTFHFVGIALNTTTTGGVVTYARPGGVVCNQSGLSPGLMYYLNGSAGQVSTTPATLFAKVGTALSATCLQIQVPKYIVSGSQTVSGVASYFQAVGFYAARITTRSSGSNSSVSVGDDTNRGFRVTVAGADVGNLAVGISKAYADVGVSGAAVNTGTITSKSQYGFVLNNDTNNGGSMTAVEWTAFSE